MSESDDTDVLLLIPPDYFLADASSSEGSVTDILSIPSYNERSKDSLISYYHHTNKNNYCLVNTNKQLTNSADITSKNYTTRPDNFDDNTSHFFKMDEKPNSLYNSPLKYSEYTSKNLYNNNYATSAGKFPESQILLEIDNFLHEGKSLDDSLCLENSIIDVQGMTFNNLQLISENDNQSVNQPKNKQFLNEVNQFSQSNFKVPSDKKNQELINFQKYSNTHSMNAFNHLQSEKSNELLSLSEMWGPDAHTNDNLSLKEERLKREHCEKMIQELQGKLLEFQQKISIAIRVDKSKDDALHKMHQTNNKLTTIINQLQATNLRIKQHNNDDKERLDSENKEMKQKSQLLEKEIAQATELANKIQDRNQSLEAKVEQLTTSSNEIRDIYKKQLEDLEIRLSNSKQNEQLQIDNNNKLKEELKIIKINYEKGCQTTNTYKKQLEELQDEFEILKQQKCNIHEKFKEEKHRADLMEKHKINLEQTVDKLIEKEKLLQKEIDEMRVSLKQYYQKQLEQVVQEKLKEFQSQLDTVEDNLKTDAKQRERIIAERAIKQMELINQKNEQEVSLLIEKHNEEIGLYRIQLVNSSKTIDQLENKLSAYQTRRADIAERLHNVMEIQWQKALEILTSPNTVDKYCNNNNNNNCNEKKLKYDIKNLDKNRLDGVTLLDNKPENEIFQTPTFNRYHQQENNNHRSVNDKLQSYIELLLKRSPRDLDKLEEILNMPSKNVTSAIATATSTSVVTTTSDSKNERQKTLKPWK